MDEAVPVTANSEIADVLRAAHDEMLIRGRTVRALINDAGEVCLRGAIAMACGLENSAACLGAYVAMGERGFTVVWNDRDTTTDDDVLEAFLATEKELREAS